MTAWAVILYYLPYQRDFFSYITLNFFPFELVSPSEITDILLHESRTSFV